MTAYLIAIRERTRKPEEYQAYKAKAPLEINGTPLVRLTNSDRFEVIEGAGAEAVSIIAFADYEHAKAWYASDDYREALEHRLRGTDFRLILVDGADSPRSPSDPLHPSTVASLGETS